MVAYESENSSFGKFERTFGWRGLPPEPRGVYFNAISFYIGERKFVRVDFRDHY